MKKYIFLIPLLIVFLFLGSFSVMARINSDVISSVYDDNNPAWAYSGTWINRPGNPTWNSTDHYTSTVGNSASITFSGTGFVYLYVSHCSRGQIGVYVDGALISTINAYQTSCNALWQSVYKSPLLSPGFHTAVFRNNSSANGWYVDVDALIVTDIPAAEQGNLNLFVLAGQSNMYGGMNLQPLNQPISPSIFKIGDNYRWDLALEPFYNTNSGVDNPYNGSFNSYGPGIPFAIALQTLRTDYPIGLIPCSVNGSFISDWQKNLSDSSPYGACLKRLRAASVMGAKVHLFFYQGESDAQSNGHYNDWATYFTQFVTDFRNDNGDSSLPVVFVQIGNLPAAQFPYYINEQASQASVSIPNVVMISAIGKPVNADGVHLTITGEQTIGIEAANAMNELLP